jgi:hypothetical protein
LLGLIRVVVSVSGLNKEKQEFKAQPRLEKWVKCTCFHHCHHNIGMNERLRICSIAQHSAGHRQKSKLRGKTEWSQLWESSSMLAAMPRVSRRQHGRTRETFARNGCK